MGKWLVDSFYLDGFIIFQEFIKRSVLCLGRHGGVDYYRVMGFNFVATHVALVHIHVLMLPRNFFDFPCVEVVQVVAVPNRLDRSFELNHVTPMQLVNYIFEL